MMTKKEVSEILVRASKEEVCRIARDIRKRHQIVLVKPPQKTLVMVKVRESIKQSLFYLGEVLATECMVTVDGEKGVSVMASDDFEKTECAAVIDGFLNRMKADREARQKIEDMILQLKEKQELSRAALNRELMKSKVNFQVMGE